MFSFNSFPDKKHEHATRRTHLNDRYGMEVDDVDGSDVPLNSKITSPGESLTSSQAFMR